MPGKKRKKKCKPQGKVSVLRELQSTFSVLGMLILSSVS